MGKQLIIAVSREFGSGGHEIGQKLAKELGINMRLRIFLQKNLIFRFMTTIF